MSEHVALIWKKLDHLARIRELRNAVNHEYEDDPAVLHEFFDQMIQAAPELLRWHDQLTAFCQNTYR